MANKRIIYNADAVFAGPTPATGAQASGSMNQLYRITSVGNDWSKNRQDVTVMGELSPISREQLDPPTVSFNASYYVSNARNESGIGLYVGGDQSALANILNDTQSEKNYYLRSVPDGNNAVGYTQFDGGVFSFGNGVLASYETQAAVGDFPTASFTVNALNASYDITASGFNSPAVIPDNGIPVTGFSVILPVANSGVAGQLAVLKPGQIRLDINGVNANSLNSSVIGLNNLCIQSYNISVDLNRTPIVCLGSQFPTSREPQFPISAQMTVEANLKDVGTGNLALTLCSETRYDVTATLYPPSCDGTLGTPKVRYTLKQAFLDGESYSDSIGPSRSVTMNFSAPMGAANEGKGLYISGSII